jgi:hypothetical protein
MIPADSALYDPEARDAVRTLALAQLSSTIVPYIAMMAVTPDRPDSSSIPRLYFGVE